MNALALYIPSRAGLRRWGLSALLVVGIHGALVGAGVWLTPPPEAVGTGSQLIMLDLETAPPTTETPIDNMPPGPVMQEAEPPAPEPEKQEEVQKEEIPPTPVQEAPEVVAPPEKPKPDPTPEPEKPKPKPVVQKKPPKKPTDTPAPRTAAPPRASQAAMSDYKGIVSAHIARFKQYPSGAKSAGEQGTAIVTFTVTRGGGASGIRITKSSGHPSLDAEAMGVIRRAQPLPAPPADVPATSLVFVMPYRFTLN